MIGNSEGTPRARVSSMRKVSVAVIKDVSGSTMRVGIEQPLPVKDNQGEKGKKAAAVKSHHEGSFPEKPPPQQLKREMPMDPQGFAYRCREIIEHPETDYGFVTEDIQKLASQIGLAPVAVFHLGTSEHWVLVTSSDGENLRVYDPVTGMRDISKSEVAKGNVTYCRGEDSDNLYMKLKSDSARNNIGVLLNDEYSLPEEPLLKMGAIQRGSSADCGPNALYGAYMSKIYQEDRQQ